jgi:polyphosphate kinase
MTPVLDPRIKNRLETILEVHSSDNLKTWELHPDGRYDRVSAPEGGGLRGQQRFMEIAKERSKKNDLSRGSAFHVLDVPQTEEERKIRRAKERQKKKQAAMG